VRGKVTPCLWLEKNKRDKTAANQVVKQKWLYHIGRNGDRKVGSGGGRREGNGGKSNLYEKQKELK